MYNLLFLEANGALMYKIHNTNRIREIEHTGINIMVKHQIDNVKKNNLKVKSEKNAV